MGEPVGSVSGIGRGEIYIKLNKGVTLNNGDGFSFVSRFGKVEGFRGDVCSGNTIKCKTVPSLFVGALLYRNINSAFEKEIERQACTREIQVATAVEFTQIQDSYTRTATAVSEDRTLQICHRLCQRQRRPSVHAGLLSEWCQERTGRRVGFNAL